MSELKISGTINKIFNTVQVTEKFCKREFVLETSGKYPEFVKFQVIQDKCEWLDKYEENEPITVHFNLKGKPYEKNGVTSYFNNLDCWKIEGESKTPKLKSTPKITITTEELKMMGSSLDSVESDDLPF